MSINIQVILFLIRCCSFISSECKCKRDTSECTIHQSTRTQQYVNYKDEYQCDIENHKSGRFIVVAVSGEEKRKYVKISHTQLHTDLFILIICPSALRSLKDWVASRVQIVVANTFTFRTVWKF